MKQRNPIAVALLPLVTFGIYSLVWLVKTKGEMNRQGADIPTAWLIIIPFVSIWWTWKYSEGVQQVTGNKMSTVISFILLMLLGSIGAAVVQHTFNDNDTSEAQQPVAQTPPVEQLETPQTVQPTNPAEQPAVTPDSPPTATDNSTSTPPPTV